MTILIGAAIFVLGGALQAAAQSLGYLYAGRALAGVGYVKLRPCQLKVRPVVS